MIPTLLLLAGVVAADPPAGGPPAPAENPYRDARVGDWVRHKTTGEGVAAVVTQTVTARTANALTLKTEPAFGGKPGPAAEVTIDLKTGAPAGPGQDRAATAEAKQLDAGAETLAIGGAKYACRWVKTRVTVTPADGPAVEVVTKTWTSADVPLGGVVRAETERGGRTTVTELVAFGRGGPPPAPPGAASGGSFADARVGDWVRYKITGPGVDAILKQSVIAATADAVTVRTEPTDGGKPGPVSEAAQDRKTGRPVGVGPGDAGVKHERLGAGTEELTAGGKRYACEWVKTRQTSGRGDGAVVEVRKTWTCKDVPLAGVVRVETESGGRTTVAELVAFGRGGQPPAPPAGGATEKAGRRADLAQRRRSLERLERITRAAYFYQDTHGSFPADVRDKDGKALLSWRVALLPFLGEDAEELYREFRLDEPWDSEHNRALQARLPDVYRTGAEPEGATETYYQGFAGPGALFGPKAAAGRPAGVTLADVTDGPASTLAVVEAGPPVVWTRPADLPYDPKKPLPPLAGPFSNALHVGLVDGTAHALARGIEEKALRGLIEIGDGRPVPALRTLRAPLPAETAEEREWVRKRAAEARDRAAEIGRLVRERAERLGGTGDVTEADELADLLEQVAAELRAAAERRPTAPAKGGDR